MIFLEVREIYVVMVVQVHLVQIESVRVVVQGILCGLLVCAHTVKVHVLHLGENSSELVCQGLYSLHDEIWDIAACPYNKSLFTTVCSSGIVNEKSMQ